MPRYIDADEFVKRVIQYPRQSTKTIGLALADTPTADAQEVKHGKWINAKPMSGRVGKVCSACGNEAYWDSDYGQQLFDWCPYCGADMRKETEDDTTN